MNSRITDIQAEQLGALSKEGERFVIVDVRREDEFREGHIPGAIHIPHDEMEERFRELEPYRDRDLLLVCRSGRRSRIAAGVLVERGFHRVYNLKGGMLKWTGPVETE